MYILIWEKVDQASKVIISDRDVLIIIGGDLREQLKEEFFDLIIFDRVIKRLSDEFGDFGAMRGEVVRIIDRKINKFFGGIDGICVVRIEYFLY